jgi:hypothetical protein
MKPENELDSLPRSGIERTRKPRTSVQDFAAHLSTGVSLCISRMSSTYREEKYRAVPFAFANLHSFYLSVGYYLLIFIFLVRFQALKPGILVVSLDGLLSNLAVVFKSIFSKSLPSWTTIHLVCQKLIHQIWLTFFTTTYYHCREASGM